MIYCSKVFGQQSQYFSREMTSISIMEAFFHSGIKSAFSLPTALRIFSFTAIRNEITVSLSRMSVTYRISNQYPDESDHFLTRAAVNRDFLKTLAKVLIFSEIKKNMAINNFKMVYLTMLLSVL